MATASWLEKHGIGHQLRQSYIKSHWIRRIGQGAFIREEREFLLTLKQESPQWKLIGVPNVDKLPAIQWKLANIKK